MKPPQIELHVTARAGGDGQWRGGIKKRQGFDLIMEVLFDLVNSGV